MIFHIKKENILLFSTNISTWFFHNKKNYPWRHTRDPYAIWLSEILLQQTQAERVVDFYANILVRFPTVFDMASVSYETFFPYYKGLGYYRRAQNILKTARIIVEQYNGVFPSLYQDLIALPGIGSYTAHAILAFSFQKKVLAVDTNLLKVFGRFFYGTNTCTEKEIQTFTPALSEFLPELNGAIMDFANTVCTKNPKCSQCPLHTHCVLYSQKETMLPILEKRSVFPKDQITYVVLHTQHTEYFSVNENTFSCFVFEAKTSRRDIQNFFKHTYNIEVSVRPPRKKWVINNKGYVLVYAQIQIGEWKYGRYTKHDVHEVLQNLHCD